MRKLKVLQVKSLGRKQTYSLRMKSEQHNFLLSNGVVSGNSHAVAYSYITYYCGFLKAHWPEEFYCALLTCEDDPDKKIRFAASVKEMGLTMLPPDVNSSELNYTPIKGSIRFGLGHVKNVSSKMISKIIKERNARGEFKSMEDLTQRVTIDKKTIQALGLSGALSSLESDLNEKECERYGLDWVDYWKKWNAATKKEKEVERREKENERRKANKEPVLKPLQDPTFPTLPVLPKVSYSGREAISIQRDMLNMYISGHPLDEIKEVDGMAKMRDLWMFEDGDFVTVCGVLLSVKHARTKKQQMYAMIRMEDRTRSMEMLVFPKHYQKYSKLLEPGNILQVSGIVKKQENYDDDVIGSKSDVVKMFANKMKKIEPPSEKTNWAVVCPLLKGKMKIEGGDNVAKSFVDNILNVHLN